MSPQDDFTTTSSPAQWQVLADFVEKVLVIGGGS
jgi:hypothetical protein